MKNKSKEWSERSPQEQAVIKANREQANYGSPFSGKNAVQRASITSGFIDMREVHAEPSFRGATFVRPPLTSRRQKHRGPAYVGARDPRHIHPRHLRPTA